MKKHTLLLACAMRILLNLIALRKGGADDTRIPSSNMRQSRHESLEL